MKSPMIRMPRSFLPGGSRSATSLLLIGLFVVFLPAVLFYLDAAASYFLADDFIFLNQLHFGAGAPTDSLAYFGRDWEMGAAFYRPLIRLFWLLEYSWFGMDARYWHLISILLHAVSAVLLFGLLWRITRRISVSVLSAALFTLHPSHPETVYWIANQTDILAALFVLAGILCYLHGRSLAQEGSRPFLLYLMAAGLFLLALLSKESAAGAFLIPAAYDLALSRHHIKIVRRLRFWRAASARYAPFALLAACYLGVRLNVLGGIGGYGEFKPVELGAVVPIYARWLLPLFSFNDSVALLALLLIVFLCLGSLVWLDRLFKQKLAIGVEDTAQQLLHLSRTPLFGLFCLILLLLPTITTAPSARFVYLATIGLSISLAVLLPSSLTRPGICLAQGYSLLYARLALKERVGGALITASAQYLTICCLLVALALNNLDHQFSWLKAGQQVEEILAQLKRSLPNPVDYSFLYISGLPEANERAPMFRTGFAQAVQLLYNNETILGTPVTLFPIVEAHLHQTNFMEYRNGQLIPRPELVEALLERNDDIKKKKEQVLIQQNFAAATMQHIRDPAVLGWSSPDGAALRIEDGLMKVTSPAGGRLRLTGFEVPAPVLGNLELDLQVGSPVDEQMALGVQWWVRSPDGEVRRASSAISLEPRDRGGSFRIKPSDMSLFYCQDIVSSIIIDVPPAVRHFAIARLILYKLPTQDKLITSQLR